MRTVLTSLVIIAITANLFAQQPTVWRNGTDGIYPDTDLLDQWPVSGPEVLWVFEGLNQGFSSPVFAHGNIYVSTMIEEKGYIIILSMDGKELKRFEYGEEWYKNFPGTRSTPVIVDDWLYIFSGNGVLYAMNALNGETRWKVDFMNDMDGENITWGVTETVVVDGGVVYCTPGGKENNIIALNRFNGEKIWSSPGVGDLSAYCTPLLVKLQNRTLLVTMMASHIIGMDTKTGKLLWSYEQTNRWSVHANTPVYRDGYLYCMSGYGTGTVCLKLADDGSSVSKVWLNEQLDSRIGGIVPLNGYLYASGDKSRQWMCVDMKTGEAAWITKDFVSGVTIAADGKLFLYVEKGGILAMVEATPEKFNLISQTVVEHGTAQHWAHPVIKDGILYQRHGDALIAYKIK